MASLDSLPPDQRAVLQLVLQRGNGYDEIAKMLSIDRAGVRDRALRAFDALGPHTRVPQERRALITDYLLGQLPDRVGKQTRERLAESASERAWARVLASELAPIAKDPLPEIPVDSGREESTATGAPEGPDEDETIPPDYGLREPEPAGERPSSRRGGALLLGIGALAVIAAVVIVIIATSGSSKKHTTSAAASTPPSSTPASSTPGSSTPASSTPASSTPGATTTTGAQLIAQVNLVSPAGGKKTAGVAQVIKQGASTGLVIVAQGVPANTSHDAYAVWLYNGPSDSHILGFVNPGVKTDGKLQTAGVLPGNASHFKQLLVTLETQAKPTGPGKIVLEGALSLG